MREFNYWIFLVGQDQEFLKCIYKGSEVIGKFDDEMIRVPKGFTMGSQKSQHMSMIAQRLQNKGEEEKQKEMTKHIRTNLDEIDMRSPDDDFNNMNYYKQYKDSEGNWKNWSKGDIVNQNG